MKTARVAARVSSSGAIELLEPVPDEFFSTEVHLLIYDRAGNGQKFDPWDLLAYQTFFDDDDDEDAIYDSIE